MDQVDSVHKRLSALAEWLTSSAEEAAIEDANTLYQNHVTYLYHPYANFTRELAYGTNGSATPSSKPQRERTTFTENHIQILEKCFNESSHPDARRREKLSLQLGLPAKTIQIWFQNRRAKERKGGKGLKRSSEGNIKTCQSLSDKEGIYYLDINPDGATTIVQEIDSSQRHENKSSQESMQENDNTTAEFTIIHIPEEQLKPNTNNQNRDFSNMTRGDIKVDQTNSQEISDESSNELIEQFMSSVENLNLDLIVKAYEVLQSSENADILIKNWLNHCSKDEEYDVDKMTLEEKLKQFIQFSQMGQII